MPTGGGISKRELKAPDPFLTWSGRVIGWTAAHARLLLGALAAVTLVGLGVLSYGAYRESNRLRAEEALFQSLALRGQGGRGREVADALSRVVSRYGGYPGGERARLFLGEELFRLGRYPEAEQTFRAALGAAPLVDPGIARRGLAKSQAAAGRCPQAVPLLEEMTKAGGELPEQDLYLTLGQCYETTGDLSKALATYRQLRQKHPGSPYLSPELEGRLKDLERRLGEKKGGAPGK